MRTPPPFHLSPDELDACLEGRLSAESTSHLATCRACQELAELDRRIAAELDELPLLAPREGFVDRVMAAVTAPHLLPHEPHLTAEDFDAWLVGTLGTEARAHLTGCSECRVFAELERELADRLAALPLLTPAPEFADRIMAGLDLPAPVWSAPLDAWRSRVLGSRRSRALAASMGATLLGSMGGSVAWSLTHQDTIASIGSWLAGEAGQWFWVGLQGLASNLIEQPWYDEARSLATPSRLAALSAAGSALYISGILALRRLLALPTPQVPHAAH